MKVILSYYGLLLLMACSSSAHQSSQQDKSGFQYLALGDSYTIGESVSLNDNFPNQLAKLIEVENPSINSKIIARTGWTTANLQQALNSDQANSKTVDLVTLLIGVNNEFQGRSTTEYRTEFEHLAKDAIRLTGGKTEHVVVLSIPDYGYTPYGKTRQESISVRIDTFNAINKEIAESLHLKYVDITPISRNGLKTPNLVAQDGLHPSGEMYKLWAEEVKKSISYE